MTKAVSKCISLLAVALLLLSLAPAACAEDYYAPVEAVIPVGGTGAFTLSDEAGEIVATMTAEGYGAFTLRFDEPGDYRYIVASPEEGNAARYAALVSVTVGAEDKLSAQVVVAEAESGRKVPAALYPITLVDPPIRKVVTGDRTPLDATFTFLFQGVSTTAEGLTAPPMPEGAEGQSLELTIQGPGEIEAGVIVFDRAGEYVYEYTEVKGADQGYAYDEAVYRLIFQVEETETGLVAAETLQKDGEEAKELCAEFTNRYTAPKGPKTGDENSVTLWIVLMLLALLILAAAAYLLLRKRKEQDK